MLGQGASSLLGKDTDGATESLAPPEPAHSHRRRADGTVLFTTEELATYDGRDGRHIYLSFAGRVFDVTAGRQHYDKDKGGYGFFAGTDATRGYVTGALYGRPVAYVTWPWCGVRRGVGRVGLGGVRRTRGLGVVAVRKGWRVGGWGG